MEVNLEPKQVLAFTTLATETLFGGAAGGGKSYELRVSAIRWCLEIPGIQVYLFRRTLPDLRDNHLRGPTNFFVLLANGLKDGRVKYRAQENEFEFYTGEGKPVGILHLCYCDSENDVEKYRGAEIHVLCMDELTHFSEYQYRFLRSRVRVAGLKIPEQYKARLPRIESASNPGSIGHAWVKRAFISPKPENTIWKTPADEGGMLRQFIPAKLADNPYLTTEDPNYADRLRGLGADSLVRAMLDGDWNIIAGQAFEKLRKDIHGIEPFEPPEDWLICGSLDWGSTRPFSFGIWTIANGNALPDGRIYPRGAAIRYNEWYGWNGKPNEGLRMEVAEVAEGILTRCRRKMAYCVADPAMWKVDGGPSHAEIMGRHGLILRKGDNSRIAGYLEVRSRIAGEETPMLYATSNCHAGFWRTMPDIVMDEAHVEDVDTDNEDHCFLLGTKVFGGEVGNDCITMGLGGLVDAKGTKVRFAPLVRLFFDDGDKIICTPKHKFCTDKGWMEARDLLDTICYNVFSQRRTQWFRSSALRVRNFLASVIIFADSIFNAKARACIASYGATLTAISPMDGTSTTLTKTGRIIYSKILNWFDREITFRIIQNEQTTTAPLKQLRLRLKNGTDRKQGENGTPSTQFPSWQPSRLTKYRRFVRYAARHLMQFGHTQTAVFIATLTARQQRCVSVEEYGQGAVTCLKVNDSSHAFALESGSLVHNCYDDVRYFCMSRPWAKVGAEKRVVKVRDYNFEEKEESSWKTF